jgi:hypothetical protein
VGTAFHRWKAYPREIERDLEAFHPNCDFMGKWHRGELSSRKLIVLTDGFLPPEHSWFKMAAYKDADKLEETLKAEATAKARKPLLSSMYRKVPEHLRPREAV